MRLQGAFMDLGSWLRSLGLERYEAAFRENAIDADVLHDLTEEHLREIGIPLGARLKLLKAIAALGSDAPLSGPHRCRARWRTAETPPSAVKSR